MDEWVVDELFALVTRAASYAQLSRGAFDATLDLVAGATRATSSPSCARASCGTARPARSPAARARSGSPSRAAARSPTAACSASSSSARRPSRVGELDEEMVYETRIGDVFALGATSWRIVDITHDRVLVTPAFGIRAGCPSGTATTWAGPPTSAPRSAPRDSPPPSGGHRASERGLDERRHQPRDLRARAARGDAVRADRSADRRRALPRRARRLAAHRPLPLRHARPRAVGARDQRPAARALRRRRPGGGVRRRHRHPHPRHRRRAAHRRPDRLRAGRDRALVDPGGRRHRALRQPVPRVRRPRPAAPPARPGSPRAALAAAAARRPAPRRREALPRLPDRARGAARGACRTSTTCRRWSLARPRAAPRHPRRRRRDDEPVPVRPPPALRLRRPVRLRGRRPARRAPRGRADARPDAARRGARHDELRELLDPAVVDRSSSSCSGSLPTGAPAASRPSPTCCGCSVRSASTSSRRASRAPTSRAGARSPPTWTPRGAGADRRRGARRGHRGRRAPPRRARRAAAARRAVGAARDGARPDRRRRRPPRAHATGRSRSRIAARLALAPAVARAALRALEAQGRVLPGAYRPGGTRRGVDRRAGAVEAQAPQPAGAAQRRRARRPRRLRRPPARPPARDAAAHRRRRAARGARRPRRPAAAAQRARDAHPALAREGLPAVDARRADRERPRHLGGRGRADGQDGWIAFHPADLAPLTIPPPDALDLTPQHTAIEDTVRGGGAYFFRQLPGATPEALWDLVWAGRLTGDTFAPVRAGSSAGGAPPRIAHPGGRRGRGSASRSTNHPRWSPADGRSPRRPPKRPIPPSNRTPSPSNCSSGTAW